MFENCEEDIFNLKFDRSRKLPKYPSKVTFVKMTIGFKVPFRNKDDPLL